RANRSAVAASLTKLQNSRPLSRGHCLMRIARRTFLTSSIGTVLAPAILGLARADTPPTTFKLHYAFSAVSGVHDKFLLPWARKIEAESGGRLHVDIFPSMQLGGAPAALFDQVRDGSADIVW